VIDVQVQETIARPRAVVAAFATDPANDTRWILALRSARQLTAGAIGPGTQVERVASFLGRRIVYVNEIVELEPGRRLRMRSVRAPFPMSVDYEFEDAGAGATVMRIRAGGDAGGFYRVAAPLLAAAVRRGIARDLAALKRRLEGSG
jgi:Polyketide cyclase / dehydrase and lipid transport